MIAASLVLVRLIEVLIISTCAVSILEHRKLLNDTLNTHFDVEGVRDNNSFFQTYINANAFVDLPGSVQRNDLSASMEALS